MTFDTAIIIIIFQILQQLWIYSVPFVCYPYYFKNLIKLKKSDVSTIYDYCKSAKIFDWNKILSLISKIKIHLMGLNLTVICRITLVEKLKQNLYIDRLQFGCQWNDHQ